MLVMAHEKRRQGGKDFVITKEMIEAATDALNESGATDETPSNRGIATGILVAAILAGGFCPRIE